MKPAIGTVRCHAHQKGTRRSRAATITRGYTTLRCLSLIYAHKNTASILSWLFMAVHRTAMLTRRGKRLGPATHGGEKSRARTARKRVVRLLCRVSRHARRRKEHLFEWAGRRVAILRAIRSFPQPPKAEAYRPTQPGQPMASPSKGTWKRQMIRFALCLYLCLFFST